MAQVVVSAANVLAGPRGQMLSPGVVLVDGDTIAAVGQPKAVAMLLRHDAIRLDYPEATIMPGLIDAHVHLAFAGPPDPLEALNQPGEHALLARMTKHAEQLLDTGVTTVRDLGDRGYLAIRLRDSIAAGEGPGPRVLSSGPPLTPPRGHCWFLGGEVATSQEIRDTIAAHADHGVDWIKVMASGGYMTPDSPPPWQPQFSADDLQLIVSEAHRRNLPVAAHAHATTAIQMATHAGVDSIEHCLWTVNAHFADAQLDDTTARVIAEKGISVAPTIMTSWQRVEQRFLGLAAHINRLLRWHDQHGIRLLHSTDVGVSPYDFYPEHNGVIAYRDARFTPARILDLLTRETSIGLGLGDRIGSLGHGYSADLLVIDGNPLEDLDALRRPLLVMARGRLRTPPGAPEHIPQAM